jgi:hypothetical protein
MRDDDGGMPARRVIAGQACFTCRLARSSSRVARVMISAIGRGGAATRRPYADRVMGLWRCGSPVGRYRGRSPHPDEDSSEPSDAIVPGERSLTKRGETLSLAGHRAAEGLSRRDGEVEVQASSTTGQTATRIVHVSRHRRLPLVNADLSLDRIYPLA